jgi:hypothetical protein
MSSPTLAPTPLPGAPTESPTQYPTSSPTVLILVVPQFWVYMMYLSGIACICVFICCCRKSAEYKRKIYQMMEEARIDVDPDQVQHDPEDDDEDEDDESTLQHSQSTVPKSISTRG